MDFISGWTLGELSALLAILGALLFWSKYISRWLKKLWDKTLGRRTAQLNRIEQELRSNTGTSVKDALKRIEDRLNEIDAFQRTSLNIHDVAVVRFNVSGKVVNINREFQRLTGSSLLESKGDGWVNVIHPDDRDNIMTRWYHAVKAQREFHEDIRFIREGKEFWTHVNVYRELDGHGFVRGYLGVIIPVAMDDNCPYRARCEAHLQLGLNDDN